MQSFKQHIKNNATDFDQVIKEELDHFSAHITEEKSYPKWATSAFLLVLSGFVPLTDRIYDELTKVRATVYHTTSAEKIKILDKNQRRKKAISTTSFLPGYDVASSGVWAGGVLCKLEGDVVFAGESDIGTIPDGEGKRWISPNTLVYQLTGSFGHPKLDSLRSKIRQSMAKDMNAYVSSMKTKEEYRLAKEIKDRINSIQLANGGDGSINSGSAGTFVNSGHKIFNIGMYQGYDFEVQKRVFNGFRQVAQTIVAKYMKMIDRVFKVLRETIVDRIEYYYHNANPRGYRNEFVVNNYVIERIAVFDFMEWLWLKKAGYTNVDVMTGNNSFYPIPKNLSTEEEWEEIEDRADGKVSTLWLQKKVNGEYM